MCLLSATLVLQNGEDRFIVTYSVFEKFNFFKIIAGVTISEKTRITTKLSTLDIKFRCLHE